MEKKMKIMIALCIVMGCIATFQLMNAPSYSYVVTMKDGDIYTAEDITLLSSGWVEIKHERERLYLSPCAVDKVEKVDKNLLRPAED